MNIVKNIESSSVVVQWDAVDDSLTTTYTVTWTSENDLSDIRAAALKEQTSYTITGLTLDTVYTITVTAANRCSCSGPEFLTCISLSADIPSCYSPTVTTSTITRSTMPTVSPTMATVSPTTTDIPTITPTFTRKFNQVTNNKRLCNNGLSYVQYVHVSVHNDVNMLYIIAFHESIFLILLCCSYT